jgi:RecB family exonuclease
VNAALGFLADFCRDHPLDEKVCLCPSFVAGRQIGEALARETGSWLHLRFVTPRSLAAEVLERSGGAGASRPMTSSAALALTDRVARELHAEGELEYFGRAGISPGLTGSLSRAIRDFRLAGLTGASVRPDRFLVERKGREFGLIVGRYERALEAEGLLDTAAFLAAALRAARSAKLPPAWILCPRNGRLSRLERDFVRAAAGDRLVLVPADPVLGLARPRQVWEEGGRSGTSDSGLLSRLFAPEKAGGPGEEIRLEIFRALGPANECREVLRRLYEDKVPFDRAEVLAPPGSPHATIFYLLSARTGLPVTFGEGVPASFTSPGRLFFGLLDWLENDLSSALLGRLLENGDLVLPAGPGGHAPAARAACRHLRSAMIGWGRERYGPRLRALREAKAADLVLAEGRAADEGGEAGEARRSALKTAISEIDALSAGLDRLLSGLPAPDEEGRFEVRAVCEALALIIRDHGRAETGFDNKARQALLDRLEEFRREGRFPALARQEALELVRTAGSSLRVGASPSLPGHLHVSGFESGGLSGRPVTFVVGLDESTFPGRGLQDPVLLDEERAGLSADLPTSADTLLAGLFGLAATLASLRGRVVFSYPCYDLVDGRESFPSSVVLQAFRLMRGEPGLDYATLDRDVADAAGFLPEGAERAFDEIDWWLDRLAGRDPVPDGRRSVAANFADLASGLAAEAARAGDRLTEFEGIVDVGPLRQEIDPLAGGRAVMSASRLELLARCPFAYFLKHVLKVEPPEEVEFDRTRWLDPLQRGSLIHEVLCAFMTRIRKLGEGVSARKHRGLMEEVSAEALARWKEKVPPPSDAIYESERRNVLDSLEIFLTAEENLEEKGEPVAFELEIAARAIELREGRSFLLRGFIDRVDKLGQDAYRVLDYKTGNPSDYEELVEFGRGRMIQHALYAVALEKMLAEEPGRGRPRVTRSGYLFPSRRGEGLERIVKDFDRGRLRALLEDLLALVQKGYFLAGPEAKCKFCDFAPVCGPEAPKVSAGKRDGSPDVFAAYDKLAGYK